MIAAKTRQHRALQKTLDLWEVAELHVAWYNTALFSRDHHLAHAHTAHHANTAHNAHNDRLDRLAIALSALCLLHCLAIPLAVLAAPAVTVWFSGTETAAHWLLLALAVPLSVWAYTRGYRRHGGVAATVIGGLGLALMLLGVSHLLAASWEIPLTLVGVVMVSVGHAMNIRRCRLAHAEV